MTTLIWKRVVACCMFDKRLNMAKVKSVIALQGAIGDISFRMTDNGCDAQAKGGPTREQVLHGDAFKITRANAAEFKGAIKAATFLRKAMEDALNGITHPLISGDMNKVFCKLVKSDQISALGERQAALGNHLLLKNFELNRFLTLDHVIQAPFVCKMDISTGVANVDIPAFIARRKKGMPVGASHFSILSCAVAIDFHQQKYRNDTQQGDILPLSKLTRSSICLSHSMAPVAGESFIHTVGMVFFAEKGGRLQLLKRGAMKIVNVG